VVIRHWSEQPSPLVVFPSSHCSPAVWFRLESPHAGNVAFREFLGAES